MKTHTKSKSHVILFYVLLLTHSVFLTCQDFAKQLKNVNCLSEEDFYSTNSESFYKVRKGISHYTLRVRENSPETKTDVQNYESLNVVTGLVEPFDSFKDSKTNKLIELIQDCQDTLTLEATLIKNPKLFNKGERENLRFFVKLLKAINKVHDQEKVLKNLRMDNIYITSEVTPLISSFENLTHRGLKRKVTESLSIWTTPNEAIALHENRENMITGWEDYFGVGVMMYQTFFGKPPVDMTQVEEPIDYIHSIVRYDEDNFLLTKEIIKALIGKFTGQYQIEDVQRFVNNFEKIDDRYFDIPYSNRLGIGLNNMMPATLSSFFIDKQVEFIPGMKQNLDQLNAGKKKTNQVLSQKAKDLRRPDANNIEQSSQNEIQSQKQGGDFETDQNLEEATGPQLPPEDTHKSRKTSANSFAVVFALLFFTVFC